MCLLGVKHTVWWPNMVSNPRIQFDYFSMISWQNRLLPIHRPEVGDLVAVVRGLLRWKMGDFASVVVIVDHQISTWVSAKSSEKPK